MTIDKAIEILVAYKAGAYEDTGPDLDDAIQLGIEALTHIRDFRLTVDGKPIHRLPGETPEIDSNRSLHHIKEVLESPQVSK